MSDPALQVTLSLNGSLRTTAAGTLQGLLLDAGFDAGAAMACAVNGNFVPRGRWAAQLLAEGDRIDVIAPVTGG